MIEQLKLTAAILAGFAIIALPACGGDSIPGMKDKNSGPKIVINSPDDNDEIFSSSVWIEVGVRDFTLSPENVGGEHVEGEGHFHYYVDGNASGESASKRFLVPNLDAGLHEVVVRLFGNDHKPVPGAASSRVTVLIPENSPRVKIVTPEQGASISSSSVELTIQTQNHPSGRWHAYVNDLDGEPAGIGSNPTDVVTGIPTGRHEVFVRLHHSAGDPYDPDVVDRVVVNIPEDAPRVKITSPQSGDTVDRNPVIHVETENFTINQASAGDYPEQGEGHYHIYVGGYDSGHMWQEGYWPDTTLDHIPTGTRDIYVRLMNNDHTTIEPKIVDRIRLEVEE